MKQSRILNIKPIGNFINPNNGETVYKFDIYLESGECGQYRTIEEEQTTYKVGQQITYKLDVKGFNGGRWTKLIDLDKPTKKNDYKPKKNGEKFKKIDVASKCLSEAITILKPEIEGTHIDNSEHPIFDKIEEVAERLYNSVYTISKL